MLEEEEGGGEEVGGVGVMRARCLVWVVGLWLRWFSGLVVWVWWFGFEFSGLVVWVWWGFYFGENRV